MDHRATRAGGCLCGRIRYTVPATPLTVAACHCRDCQRQSGSPFSVLAVFPRAEVRIEGALSEFEGVAESGAAVQRRFCGGCGSPILSDSEAMRARGILAIKAGTLDEPADLAPGTHFWCASRQPWVPLPADATCRERN